MLLGTGVDVVEIARITHSLSRYGQRFLFRVFTPGEILYCTARKGSAESLAARFAAKEAAAKALGTGISRGVSWRELEVARDPGRPPRLVFHGAALARFTLLGAQNTHLALTHGGGLAIATVSIEG